MKKKILTILIAICLILGLGATFSPALIQADSLLVKDKYYFFDSPFYLHANENITVVSENTIYVVDANSNVTTFPLSAQKAIYENGKIIRLYNGELFVGDNLIASAVIDFDVKNNKLTYIDANAVYVCQNINQTEVISISQSGFSSIALSGNGLYLKKDMGSYNDIYFCDTTTLSIRLNTSYCKKFKSLIFDTKLLGVDGNVLYDIEKDEKTTLSPYANAISIYCGSQYYLADGCLYKDGELLLGSGKDFYFPHALDSNANNIYAVDENGIAIYAFANNKYSKTKSISAKASHIAVTTLPSVKIYYTLETDVYLDEEVIYTAENAITDIAVDSDNNIYYTTDSSTYKNGEKIYDIGGLLAIAPSKKDIYNFFDNQVYKNGEPTSIICKGKAFDVDGIGNIYVLTSNDIKAFTVDGIQTATYFHNAQEPVDLDISYETNTLGKLSVVDRYGHNVIFVDADVYIPTFSSKDEKVDDELLRSVTSSTPVFSDLNRSKIVAKIPAESIVICPNFNIECDDYLAYVSIKTATDLISGYVEKTMLSDAILGSTPRYNVAKTLYDNVTLHSLPCGLQEFDNNFVKIISNKNTEFNLISKYNIFDSDWYKAEYDGSIGYVNATQIQLGGYVPEVYPDTNAKLIKASAVYDIINGSYVEDTIFLAKDTSVEVVGVFDSNTEYTQIRYYDNEAGGTRTCYVKTASLKYDYVTFEQQFALIAVIILSVSTIIVIIIFTKHRHKKR